MEYLPIIDLIKQEQSFCLVAHVLPDGDSVGSLLALGEALENMGKDVLLYSPGAVPRKYAFLKGSERIATTGMEVNGETIVIALDSSDLERLGVFKEKVALARSLINIDHHVTNQCYGTLNLVDPNSAATGEMVYRLLQEMGAPMTVSIAEALYVAIATDTGSFKYDNTTPATHQIAASLLEHKVNPATLSQRVFDERPLSFYLLLKEALTTLEIHSEGKIAVITVSYDMLESCGTTVEEIEGLVNYTRSIEGIELGILIYVEGPEEVKVGFRSRGADVSRLAEQFNGGGHAKAAGCRMHLGYDKAKSTLLQAAEALLQEYEAGEKSGCGRDPECN